MTPQRYLDKNTIDAETEQLCIANVYQYPLKHNGEHRKQFDYKVK